MSANNGDDVALPPDEATEATADECNENNDFAADEIENINALLATIRQNNLSARKSLATFELDEHSEDSKPKEAAIVAPPPPDRPNKPPGSAQEWFALRAKFDYYLDHKEQESNLKHIHTTRSGSRCEIDERSISNCTTNRAGKKISNTRVTAGGASDTNSAGDVLLAERASGDLLLHGKNGEFAQFNRRAETHVFHDRKQREISVYRDGTFTYRTDHATTIKFDGTRLVHLPRNGNSVEIVQGLPQRMGEVMPFGRAHGHERIIAIYDESGTPGLEAQSLASSAAIRCFGDGRTALKLADNDGQQIVIEWRSNAANQLNVIINSATSCTLTFSNGEWQAFDLEGLLCSIADGNSPSLPGGIMPAGGITFGNEKVIYKQGSLNLNGLAVLRTEAGGFIRMSGGAAKIAGADGLVTDTVFAAGMQVENRGATGCGIDADGTVEIAEINEHGNCCITRGTEKILSLSQRASESECKTQIEIGNGGSGAIYTIAHDGAIEALFADGDRFLADGTAFRPSGVVFHENGHVRFADGTSVDARGQIFEHDGRYIDEIPNWEGAERVARARIDAVVSTAHRLAEDAHADISALSYLLSLYDSLSAFQQEAFKAKDAGIFVAAQSAQASLGAGLRALYERIERVELIRLLASVPTSMLNQLVKESRTLTSEGLKDLLATCGLIATKED